MTADEIDLIGDLAEALALEYADVDDEDLPSIHGGIDLLTQAQQCIECWGRQCPGLVEIVIEHYKQHVRP